MLNIIVDSDGFIFSRDCTYPEYQRLKNEFNEKKKAKKKPVKKKVKKKRTQK